MIWFIPWQHGRNHCDLWCPSNRKACGGASFLVESKTTCKSLVTSFPSMFATIFDLTLLFGIRLLLGLDPSKLSPSQWFVLLEQDCSIKLSPSQCFVFLETSISMKLSPSQCFSASACARAAWACRNFWRFFFFRSFWDALRREFFEFNLENRINWTVGCIKQTFVNFVFV